MRDMKRGEKHKYVSVSTKQRVSAPCPAVQGRVGWDFSREGARPGPSPRSSRHPHPSLLQGTAKASSGQDYVYWVDPWREAARIDPGSERSRGKEGAERGPAGSDHRPISPSLQPPVTSRQRAESWVGMWVLLWNPVYPSHQGGVADLSGQPSQGKERPPSTPSSASSS